MAFESHRPSSYALFESVLQQALKDFLHMESLHKEQKECIENLFLGRDVFAILPTGFGKSLIFQLFPRLTSQRNAVNSTIIVVTPLVAIIKDQVEQLPSFGIRAVAIGVDEEEGEETKQSLNCQNCQRRNYKQRTPRIYKA